MILDNVYTSHITTTLTNLALNNNILTANVQFLALLCFLLFSLSSNFFLLSLLPSCSVFLFTSYTLAGQEDSQQTQP